MSEIFFLIQNNKLKFYQGVGKSSVLELLREDTNWLILPEPVQEWQNYIPQEGVQMNLLGDFYSFPSERSFRLLQTQIFLSLLDRYTHARAHPAPVIVFERSLEVARDVGVQGIVFFK